MQCIFTWRIENFSSYLALLKPGDHIKSEFYADDKCGTKWVVYIYPKGNLNYAEFVSVHLMPISQTGVDPVGTKLKCEVSILDRDSRVWCRKETDQDFGQLVYVCFDDFARREKILEEEARVLPGNILTIACHISAYNERILELRSQNEVETPQEGLENLSNDLKRLLDSGKFSDVVLKVGDELIPSHKAILCARSPVFKELILHVPSEGSISITDVDKSTIDALLTFMYSGKIDVKSALSSLALYNAAKQYGVQDLSSVLEPRKIFTTTQAETKRCTFTWRLSNFRSIKEKCGPVVHSDKFYTESPSVSWNLSLRFHRGRRNANENIGIYLHRTWGVSDKRPVFVEFSLHLVDKNQNCSCTVKMQECFNPVSRHGCDSLTDTENLLGHSETLLPSGTLTVRCELIEYNGNYASSTRCSHFSANSDLLRMSYVQNVRESLLELVSNDIACDVKVSSMDGCLSLHKSILCARSTKFAAMLENVDTYSSPHTIEILHTEPSILEILVSFIYTGECIELTAAMAPNLYKTARRYNITDLGNICLDFLKSKITLNNVCEMLVSAHELEIPELKYIAKDFMCRFANDLMASRQWRDFSEEHPHLANEVFTSLSAMYCLSRRDGFI